MAEISFELCIEILLAVLAVRERVKAASIPAILIQYKHRDCVRFSRFKQRRWHQDSVVAEDFGGRLDLLVVDFVLTNFDASVVEEEVLRWLLFQHEGHSDLACVPFTFGQTQVNVVSDIRDVLLSVLCSVKCNVVSLFVGCVL